MLQSILKSKQSADTATIVGNHSAIKKHKRLKEYGKKDPLLNNTVTEYMQEKSYQDAYENWFNEYEI